MGAIQYSYKNEHQETVEHGPVTLSEALHILDARRADQSNIPPPHDQPATPSP